MGHIVGRDVGELEGRDVDTCGVGATFGITGVGGVGASVGDGEKLVSLYGAKVSIAVGIDVVAASVGEPVGCAVLGAIQQ